MLEFDISNTEISKNDMSDMRKSERYEYNVLLYIIRKGEPTAAYEISKALDMNQPTVWNVCQRLKKNEQLTEEDGSRSKLMYGPTWEGFDRLCFENQKMLKEIDTMLDGWFDQQKFNESLRKDFGEVVTKNPDYAKILTKKMIKYYSRIEEQKENITDEEWDFMEHVLAEKKLLEKYPAEIPNVTEFYKNVKFYRDDANRALGNQQQTKQFFNSIAKT